MASKDSPDSEHDIDAVDDPVIDTRYLGSRDDSADSRTVASRQRLRDQLSGDVEAFLARGGKIDQVSSHITADPPRRPNSNYGQRPI